MTDIARAELPPPRSLLNQIGPGVILLALSQGSGELIWWPYLIARYGLVFLCLLIPASLIQWPVTQAIGRYTVTTGETVVRGLARSNPRFAKAFWAMFTVSFLWFGAYASAGGTALAELTGFPAGLESKGRSLTWAFITIALFGASLFISRGAYSLIKRSMFFVAVITTGLLFWSTVFNAEVRETADAFLPGLWTKTEPLRPLLPGDAKVLVTALLFAGLGGFWNIFYSNWILRAGYGMSAINAPVPRYSGLRGLWHKLVDTDHGVEFPTGHVPAEDSPDGPRRLRRWLRLLTVDTGIGVVGNLLTTLLLCWLAFVYLTPTGTVPNGWQLASVQARFFEHAIPYGRVIFLTIAALFLADTWLTTVDAVARVHTEFSLEFFPRAASVGAKKLYWMYVLTLTVITIGTMLLRTPEFLILLTGILNAAAMIFLCAAIYVLNHRFLRDQAPTWAKPGALSAIGLLGSAVAYLGLFIWYIFVDRFV